MSEWGYGGENGTLQFSVLFTINNNKLSASNNNLLQLYSSVHQSAHLTVITPCPGPSCWHMVDDGIYSISLSGTRQSPINIETAASVLETDETLEELQHEYQVSSISLLLDTRHYRYDITRPESAPQ